MKNISILGSTGSIGTQALDVIRKRGGDFNVCAISGNSNTELLLKQYEEFRPELICAYNAENAETLKKALKEKFGKNTEKNLEEGAKMPEIVSGMEGLVKAAVYEKADIVLSAVVGMIGIRPVIEAIHSRKDIALANKETLVCAGHIIMDEAKKCGARIYPVDSEHSAIFQSLCAGKNSEIESIILTCSGGPFRGMKKAALLGVTAADALRHPTWSMGKKITVDSATLANKGLEVIEARWLFDVPAEKIKVVIHPQSVIHSAVQYRDGAIIAQMGAADMRVPIQYALCCPNRPYLSGKRLDLAALGALTFEEPDTDTFRALSLAYEAINKGGSMPAVFNAANERAVGRFLKGETGFLDIAEEIETAMRRHKVIPDPSLEEIIRIGEDIIPSF